MIQITALKEKDFNAYVGSHTQKYALLDTPAGPLLVLGTEDGVTAATYDQALFAAIIARYSKADAILLTHFIIKGTPLQAQIWEQALNIPAGSTMTYQELAVMIGRPRAYRFVANTMAQNNIAYLLPCHRVIGKDGTLRGYKWGLAVKQVLLEAEKSRD
jgi:O-6-methylguanine DNA methyltransferase